MVRVYRFDGEATDAAPLVLLPGRASATPVWADNIPSLVKLGDVYAIDLLGEPGLSVQERPIESDEDQAAWLAETLKGLPEPGFHLVGLSIGGWTAANLAIREPDQVLSVTLLDPVMVFADLAPEVIVRSIPISMSWAPRSWRDSFSSWVAGGAPVEDVPVADMIESAWSGTHCACPHPPGSRSGAWRRSRCRCSPSSPGGPSCMTRMPRRRPRAGRCSAVASRCTRQRPTP